jgi:hypothetical protein
MTDDAAGGWPAIKVLVDIDPSAKRQTPPMSLKIRSLRAPLPPRFDRCDVRQLPAIRLDEERERVSVTAARSLEQAQLARIFLGRGGRHR